MKKLLTILAAIMVATLALVGCGGNQEAAKQDAKVLKVGATPVPHAEVLEQIKDDLKKDGIELQIVEFSDYVQPNLATNDKELDANYFQHQPYLDDFNAENGTHIVSVSAPHVEPMGIYGGKKSSLDDLKK